MLIRECFFVPYKRTPFSHLFQICYFRNVSKLYLSTLLWTIQQGLQKTMACMPRKREWFFQLNLGFLRFIKVFWKRMGRYPWKQFSIPNISYATKTTSFIWRKSSTIPCSVSNLSSYTYRNKKRKNSQSVFSSCNFNLKALKLMSVVLTKF